jgi:hypothetical protein
VEGKSAEERLRLRLQSDYKRLQVQQNFLQIQEAKNHKLYYVTVAVYQVSRVGMGE